MSEEVKIDEFEKEDLAVQIQIADSAELDAPALEAAMSEEIHAQLESSEDILTEEVISESQDSELSIEESESEAAGLLPLLQALFISSSDPLDLETLSQVCEVEKECITEALKLLATQLEGDNYGFSLVAVAKGFQLRTKAQFARYIRTLRQESPRKLSPAALETLAVIAYRQPVVKHDIDGLRGVDVMPTLKTLLERGLIQVVGHRETVGHPSLYGTTEEFLKIFGLNSLEDLPTVSELNHMKAEPGEEAGTTYENPLASLVRNDQEHVTSASTL